MYFWWEVNFIFKYLIKFQSVIYCSKHICHIWASTSASFITCVSQANRYHDVLQRSLCLSDFQISHKSKICEILQWKSATFASFNFLSPSYRHHDVPQRSVRWQDRPGGWGHRGQRGEARGHHHPWWQDIGRCAGGRRPWQEVHQGGAGAQSHQTWSFAKGSPGAQKEPSFQDCAWKSSKYLTVREILLQIHNISRLQNLWDISPKRQYLMVADFVRYNTSNTISGGCRFCEILHQIHTVSICLVVGFFFWLFLSFGAFLSFCLAVADSMRYYDIITIYYSCRFHNMSQPNINISYLHISWHITPGTIVLSFSLLFF